MPLYIVATPIGNLDDLTPRAASMLRGASAVFAEDTRHSKRLLNHIGSSARLRTFHDYSDERAVDAIVLEAASADVCLISDAGTPCISDPGYALVRAAREAGVPVVPIPGASAVIAFLSVAGLPTNRFRFEGFLPAKGNVREEALAVVLRSPDTTVLYESPKRIRRLLDAILASAPDRELAFGRELTKRFEQVVVGDAATLIAALDDGAERGEFVLGVAGSPEVRDVSSEALDAWIDALLEERMRTKSIASVLSKQLGVRKSDVYQRALSRAEAAKGGS